MRLKNNEDGSTLLMVILLVAVIAILGTALFAMNASATKQFSNKEEQVQARHLAEMGVEHYHTAVEEVVKIENKKPIKYEYKDAEETEIDEISTLATYLQRLCDAINEVEVKYTYERDGKKDYVVSKNDTNCEGLNEIIFSIESTGNVEGTKKIIEAEITVTESGTSEENNGNTENMGNAVKLLLDNSKYPASNTLTEVKTFDDIGSLEAVKVANSTSKNNRFETSAFVEVDTFNIPQKATWTFKNNLLIKDGSELQAKFDFKANHSTLTVEEDLYVDGVFSTSSNNSKINVHRNLIIKGATKIHNGIEIEVSGHALFNHENFEMWPQTDIKIGRNAYFKKTVNPPNNNKKPLICVKGDILLWKTNSWQPYTQQDDGYSVFDKECLGTGQPTSPPNSSSRYNWKVKEAVKAIYN